MGSRCITLRAVTARLSYSSTALSDYDYWSSEVPYFSRSYRAIAYSRRYDYPNSNPARRGYSAVVDADDLAAFITKFGLGKVNVVGHSYGALTADVMMTTGTLFPALDPSSVRHIMMPVLLLSGAKTYPFLRLIDEDLAHLLPDNRNFVLSKSGYQMWYQQTADTRGAVEAFLRVHGRGEAAISP